MLALNLLTLGMVAVANAGVVPEMIQARTAKGDKIMLPLKEGTITGPGHQGGPNFTFTGQHYQMDAQIAKFNGSVHHDNSTHHLEARSNRVAFWCDNGFPYADWGATASNILYMNAWPSYLQCMTPAKSCSRFACFVNAAVLMCNDTPRDVMIPCSTLRQNANFIQNSCAEPFWGRVEGQAFYQNPSYNVLIKHTDKGKECGTQQKIPGH